MTTPDRRLHAVADDSPAEKRRAMIARYGIRLAAGDKRPRTVEIYTEAATNLTKWLEAKGIDRAFEEVTVDELEDFLHAFRHGDPQLGVRPHSAGYTNQVYRSLRQFYGWLARAYEIANPMLEVVPRRVGQSNVEDKVLTDEQIDKILATVSHGRGFDARRDHAILRLFLIGLRRGEVTGLRVGDVDMQSRTLFIRSAKSDAKGARHRRVGFGRKTLAVLDDYLMTRDKHPHHWREELWIGKRGPVTASGIYQIVRDRAAQAGLRIHPHQFRHTAADRWLADDGSEGHLMANMGWESRQMVDLYAAATRSKRALQEYQRRAIDDRY